MAETDRPGPGELRDVTLDPTRELRYAELFAVGEEWITVYNSMGLSEAPPELWDSLDAEAAAQHLGTGTVLKNGPHWWVADLTTLQFGVEPVSVGGIGFRFAARLPAFLAASGRLEPPFYTEVEANKIGRLVYAAGRPVYELASPEGEAFVMQSSSVEPDEFPELGEKLSLAEGWSYRTRNPDEDLVVNLDGQVRVVMDDLHNVYNAR